MFVLPCIICTQIHFPCDNFRDRETETLTDRHTDREMVDREKKKGKKAGPDREREMEGER